MRPFPLRTLPRDVVSKPGHSFRVKAITVFLSNGGSLENAQAIAEHSSPKTTKLYDRRGEKIALSEIARILI